MGITGSGIVTRRHSITRTQTRDGVDNDVADHRSSREGLVADSKHSNNATLTNIWISDSRIPTRIARRSSLDIQDLHKYEAQSSHSTMRESRYSYRTTDSELTTDSEFSKTSSVEANVFLPGRDNQNVASHSQPSMEVEDLGGSTSECDWKQRMSAYVNGLPNFALGSTTRDYTHKRPRLLSDKSVFHDAVFLEKRNKAQRYRKGINSSSDSSFSRLSSCSSRDSIQHWVDSLDENENSSDITVGSGSHKGAGSSVEYTSGCNPRNIPGYGQPVSTLISKKESLGNVDDLSLGADASCITRNSSPQVLVDTNGNSDVTTRNKRVGSSGRILQRHMTNSQIIAQAQQHRTIQGRRLQLQHMGGSGVSDVLSDYSIRTASSIAELLLMRNDPEEILLALGFGTNKRLDYLDRIPARFLQPSRMSGISVQEFLHRMEVLEKGYGFNVNGGLRGLEYVLDRRRTNSLIKQPSTDEDEQPEEDKKSSAVNEETSLSEDEQEQPMPPIEPNLEEIYVQRQPAQVMSILNNLHPSLDSRDSLLSSMDTGVSDYESFDLISHSGPLDQLRYMDQNCNAKDSSYNAKDVFRSSAPDSSDSLSSGIDKDSNLPAYLANEPESPENLGALSEEQINEIREELMLRAQSVRSRMAMPAPQLASVDEELECEPQTPYRIGSLDAISEEKTPDRKKLFTSSEEHHHGDKKRSSNITRTFSTPEMEMHQQIQKRDGLVDKHDVKTPTDHHTGEESSKLKPVHQRLLKENGHGGQESFEIEEISSTENQDELGSPGNKTNEKPSEHGTLSRNPSTQSDSSGFADEGDTPTSKDTSDTHQIMTTSGVQTSFDNIMLDNYDQDSFCSQPDSIEPKVRMVAERRESFKNSRGTSIIDEAMFSNITIEDDDAFFTGNDQLSVDHDVTDEKITQAEAMFSNVTIEDNNAFFTGNDQVSVDHDLTDKKIAQTEELGKDGDTKGQEYRTSKLRPLRRSGTFPGISDRLNKDSGPKTVPEILTSLQANIQKAMLASQDLSSSSVLSVKRKRLMSRMHSVDIEHYSADDHLDRQVSCQTHFESENSLEAKQANEPFRNLLPVCEESIVPSIVDDTQTVRSRELDTDSNPVHESKRESSTQNGNEHFLQDTFPMYESLESSGVSSCSPRPEPDENYSLLLSPPRSVPTAVQTVSSTTQHMVLTQDENSDLLCKVPSSDRSWHVTEATCFLEQHRTSEDLQSTQSSCISELNAVCEPLAAPAVRLRSSLEIVLSGNSKDKESETNNVSPIEKSNVAACLPGNKCLHDPLCIYKLSAEDKEENWYKAMVCSTPKCLPVKKFSQYGEVDVQGLQTALQKYKSDLSVLQAKSDMVYSSVDKDLTNKDRCELEALGCIRRQIMGEIATMEDLLAKKLQAVTIGQTASVDSDEAQLLAASAENLDIIGEMVGLLEEQRSMQYFIQDMGVHTDVFDGQATEVPSSVRETSTDRLLQEMTDLRREVEECRTLAKEELKAAANELKDSLVMELRREFALDINDLKSQLQAKDDEIKRLRALLGETKQVEYLAQSSPNYRYGQTENSKQELQQLRDLLLRKASVDHDRSQDYRANQSRDGNR